jgi:hypothetical protein
VVLAVLVKGNQCKLTGGIVGAILITRVGFNRTGNGLRHLSMVISERLPTMFRSQR